jgi:hypothetical protein
MRYSLLLAAAISLCACGGKTDSRADSAGKVASAGSDMSGDVRTAVAVDSALKASPSKADSILKAHQLTAAGFDSLMYRIAEDSSLRAQYAAARH